MDIKDWIYTAGLLVTFLISLASLIVNIRNRKNALREHIYKEQIQYFKELSEVLDYLSSLFHKADILDEKELDKIEELINEMYSIIAKYDFLSPDEIFKMLTNIIKLVEDLSLKTIKKSVDKETIKAFDEANFDLLEEMRFIMGIDKLSEENRNLYGLKRQ